MSVRLRLWPGDSTSITVSPTLPSSKPREPESLSGVVRLAEIDACPEWAQLLWTLALLVPGVSRTNTGAPQQFAETSAVPGTAHFVSSQRNLNNNFVLDGLISK